MHDTYYISIRANTHTNFVLTPRLYGFVWKNSNLTGAQILKFLMHLASSSVLSVLCRPLLPGPVPIGPFCVTHICWHASQYGLTGACSCPLLPVHIFMYIGTLCWLCQLEPLPGGKYLYDENECLYVFIIYIISSDFECDITNHLREIYAGHWQFDKTFSQILSCEL